MLVALYRKVQYLSLDITFGAVILLHFFSRNLNVNLSLYAYILLAGGVWIIYTVDHLQDSRTANNSVRLRYEFHRKNKNILLFLVVLLALVCFCCVLQIERDLMINGSILGFLSAVYLLIQKKLARIGFKEVYVAIIYTGGILVAPLTAHGAVVWEMVGLLFFLALSNLILFSIFEKTEDTHDSFDSMATVFTQQTADRIVLICLSLGMSTVFLMDISEITVYFLLAYVIYAFIFVSPKWSQENFRYRVIGDGIFILPIIFEWM